MKVRDIAKIVSDHFDLSVNQLLSGRRSTTYVAARRMCSVLAREMTIHSLQEIAETLGMSEPTTVRHHIRTHPIHMRDNWKYANDFNAIRRTMGLMPERLPAEAQLRAVA